MTFEELWKWIERAHNENWRHVRRHEGIKLAPGWLFTHLVEEVGEMAKALTCKGNDLEEIGDVMCILMHYAIAQGFTEKEVRDQMEVKLVHNIKPPEEENDPS